MFCSEKSRSYAELGSPQSKLCRVGFTAESKLCRVGLTAELKLCRAGFTTYRVKFEQSWVHYRVVQSWAHCCQGYAELGSLQSELCRVGVTTESELDSLQSKLCIVGFTAVRVVQSWVHYRVKIVQSCCATQATATITEWAWLKVWESRNQVLLLFGRGGGECAAAGVVVNTALAWQYVQVGGNTHDLLTQQGVNLRVWTEEH